ncbi:MAG TPA: hypothetical protein VF627_05730 [Abditibacterium sp.]|jgi:hypothetical protein
MAQVKQGLKDKNPTELAQHGENVVAAMTGNANFAAPNPPLAELTAAVGAVRGNLATVESTKAQLSADNLAVRDSSETLRGLLTGEGNFVQTVADSAGRSGNGDPAQIIKSAAMEVAAEAAPIGSLPAPTGLSATDGATDGDINAHCNRVKGAGSYFWETCVGDNPISGTWGGTKGSTAGSIVLTGYEVGKRVWVRVAALGAAGQGAWSEPVSLIVT